MGFDPGSETGLTVPGTDAAATAPLRDPSALALIGALQGLHRAYQKLAMYPAGHPSVPEAISIAASGFEEALAGREWVVLGVTNDELVWDDETISAGSAPLGALATLLHDLNMAAVEFRAGLSARELDSLVHLLARARRESVAGPRLVEALEHERVDRIRLCAIDYRALSFGEGVQQTPSGDGAKMWQQLSRVLTDPETYAGSASVEGLAGEVSDRIQAYEGTGVNGLRSELQRQVKCMGTLGDEERKIQRRRLGEFVSALNPDLRRNLLQVGATGSTESLSLMNELAETIPPGELLEALENVDRLGGSAHVELVTLLNKLVRISHDRPVVQDQLEDTLGRWGVSPSALHTPGDLGSAVEEVLQRRTREEFNPVEYQDLLGDLPHEQLSGEIPASAALYGGAADTVAMTAHCAEIAVLLLGRSDGDEQRAALFGYVGAHADGLLRQGKFAPVVHAAVAARADRTLKADNEPIRRAAQGFLEDFRDEGKVGLILQQLNEWEPIPLEALGLLELGRGKALAAALERLGTNPGDPDFAASLRRFCADLSSEAWAEVLPARIAGGWPLLEPVFPVLAEMQPEAATPILLDLLGHESSRVRREALILLCDIDDESSVPAHINKALGDESLRVVNTALRRLAAMETPQALETLGAFVVGEVPGSWFSSEAFNLATGLMLARGTPGYEELCRRLDALRFDLVPSKARRGRRLARALAPKRDDSHDVRQALHRWRISPAWLLSRLSPKLEKSKGNSRQ